MTFALATYNQQGIVASAVRSALAQTYSPLEIYISDDCSSDDTVTVIEQVLEGYDGPHSVVFNKNPVNLGIGRHWDQIGRRARGELIIHAAGDDISVPERTSILVRHWLSGDERPVMLSSDGLRMTYDGQLMGPELGHRFASEALCRLPPNSYTLDITLPICGFAAATDKRIYTCFDPVTERLWSEDDLLRRRALLLGAILYFPDALVHYRDGGLSKGVVKDAKSYLDTFKAQALTRKYVVGQNIVDVEKVGLREKEKYIAVLKKQHAAASQRLSILSGSFLAALLAFLTLYISNRPEYGFDRKLHRSMFLVRWLPRTFFYMRKRKVVLRR